MDIMAELPLGFSMALAKNADALQSFSQMSESQKQAVIDGTHNIKSEVEMQEYVNNLVRQNRG